MSWSKSSTEVPITSEKSVTDPSQAKAGLPGVPGKTVRSAVSWLLFFAVLCTAVALLIPSRSLNAANGVTGTFRVLVSKLATFLPSSEQPDVVVLGSSLVLVPAVRCDDKLAGRPDMHSMRYYDHYIPEYTHSTYLEKQIAAHTGLNLSIKNLGIASSIMSDQYGIFNLMLAEHKHPKMVILGLAPRDFLDNTQQKFLQTPTRQFLNEYTEGSFFPDKLNIESVQSAATRVQHRFEKVIGLLKESSTNLACKLSGHQAQVEFNNGKAYVGERPNRLKDLETYKKLYNPPNYRMLAQQSEFLRSLLAEARKNNVSVLMINMPLTKENTDACDPKAISAYVQTLSELSKEYSAGFLNIGSTDPNYTLADFEDCCHLNGHGGEKLYGSVVSYLANDAHLVAALNNKLSNNQRAIAHQNNDSKM